MFQEYFFEESFWKKKKKKRERDLKPKQYNMKLIYKIMT